MRVKPFLTSPIKRDEHYPEIGQTIKKNKSNRNTDSNWVIKNQDRRLWETKAKKRKIDGAQIFSQNMDRRERRMATESGSRDQREAHHLGSDSEPQRKECKGKAWPFAKRVAGGLGRIQYGSTETYPNPKFSNCQIIAHPKGPLTKYFSYMSFPLDWSIYLIIGQGEGPTVSFSHKVSLTGFGPHWSSATHETKGKFPLGMSLVDYIGSRGSHPIISQVVRGPVSRKVLPQNPAGGTRRCGLGPKAVNSCRPESEVTRPSTTPNQIPSFN